MSHADVDSAEIVLPCDDLDATLAFFAERLGFRLDTIFPADAPRVAVVSGHGVRLRLEQGRGGDPGTLRLVCRDRWPGLAALPRLAPNGTRLEPVVPEPRVAGERAPLPGLAPRLVLGHRGPGRGGPGASWTEGRAGMRYRDLLPGRLEGRLIASAIRLERGGPVADWVHFHDVRLQVLHCVRGEVTVAYEDQGPPIVMRAGDTVLQPPGIRHRVLACSPGCEVVEVASPAEHPTHSDRETVLPSGRVRPEREFGGQRFVHDAAAAARTVRDGAGFTCRDTGVAAATRGAAGVRVLRASGQGLAREGRAAAELTFFHVLAGGVSLHAEGRGEELSAGDSCALTGGLAFALADYSADCELLEVTLPAGTSS